MVCLYLDKRDITLKTEKDALIVYQKKERLATFPLFLIDRICIKGSTTLTASVLGKFGQHDIGVLVLQGYGRNPTLLLPKLRKDAQRRLIQQELSQNIPLTQHFSQTILKAKVKYQTKTLLEKAEQSVCGRLLKNRIKETSFNAQQKLTFEPLSHKNYLGIEGAFAAFYFKTLGELLPASLNFNGRNKRPPKDPFNALLSLGYTLLHYEWVREIYMMGLDPFIGFYHQLHWGRESLACDLLEPFRPLYDSFILNLLTQKTVRPEDFSYTKEGCLLKKAGRLRFYEAYETWLKDILRPHFIQQKTWLFRLLNDHYDKEELNKKYQCDVTPFNPNDIREERLSA